jgi:uncharacterized protein (DUF58 family)
VKIFDPKRRAAERAAWRSFFFSMISLGVAFLLAVYSDVLASAGNVLGTAIAGSSALLLSGVVAVVWVPKLARRTSLEWLRASVDYHLTRAGLVYLAAIFIVSIAALNTGNNMLFLILAAMIAAILVSGVVSRIVLTGLAVEVGLPERVFAGSPVLARVTLANGKPLLPTFSVLAGGMQKAAVYFPFVKARTQASQTVEIVFPKRGVYKEDFVTLASRFPFGFLEKVRKIPVAREMVVYPAIDASEAFYEILPKLTGEIESFQRGRGNDLYSIRDYQYSDSARHLDWKSSARTGILKVREFAREDERRLQLIFDRSVPGASAETPDETPDETLARFERAVDECAALAWHLQEIGALVQFVTDQSRSAFAPADEIVFEILDYLARVQPGGPGINWAELDDEVRIGFGANVR